MLQPRRPRMIALLAAGVAATAAYAQFSNAALELSHPAIRYGATPSTDPAARLNGALQDGRARLSFDRNTGYLRPLLDALAIPVESQIVLFSKTSLQSPRIHPRNPRVIYFNDSVAVAWMRGGFIEIAALDRRDGAVFYTLPQIETAAPQLVRDNSCLQCHYALTTLGVPGFILRSIPSASDGTIMPWLGNYTTDHRSPLEERWGGWYVTGRTGSARHLGNAPLADKRAQEVSVLDANLNVATLQDRFETSGYLAPYSDVVALLVFEHQARMMNLLTRIGFEARTLAHEGRSGAAAQTALQATAVELVDYLLFVDEAPMNGIQGTSGFAEKFSAAGPRDEKGRSLRDIDLQRRLFKYPCSYMIYSEAFDALPPAAREAVYRRAWQILSGAERGQKYSVLSATDRRAIIEILKATKKDLPDYFS